MKIFQLGKKKNLEERKVALINQINQINNQFHNLKQLDKRDPVYRHIPTLDVVGLSQSSRG